MDSMGLKHHPQEIMRSTFFASKKWKPQHEAMEIVWSSARSWHCPNMLKQHVQSFQRYKSDTSPPTVGLKHPTTTCAFTINGDSSNLSPKRTGSPQGPSVPTTIHYTSHEKY